MWGSGLCSRPSLLLLHYGCMRRRKRQKGYRRIARDLAATASKLQNASDHIGTHLDMNDLQVAHLFGLVDGARREVDEAAEGVLWLGNR